MSGSSNLEITWKPPGRGGKATLSARLPDGTNFTDKVDLADARDRDRFLRSLCKGRKGIERKEVAAELERIAAELVAKPTAGGDEERGRLSQADRLVMLAQDADLFHTPGGYDSEGYASLTVNGHRETWPISSKGFRRWLSKRFYDEHCKAPSSQALQDAISVIAGKAVHDGAEREVAVRLAEQGGNIWLDLADQDWRVVQIKPNGWTILHAADCPVRFGRKRGVLALPEPVRGGRIEDLRRLVNLPDDDSWTLFVAWLVAALRPDRPFPILVVNGEQGSAKSTLCRMARALLDPNLAPLRRPPREDRDLMIAASNGWLVGYDNLSGIRPELSDALCSLATGGGFGTRELYSDADEQLFAALRPVLVNGIEDLATRADLLDRALTLTLPRIPDETRRDEADLWGQFEEVRPRVLGALLDAVSVALRNLHSTRLPSKPRMADFALWVTAACPALGWSAETFLSAYAHNRGQGAALALEDSVLAQPLLAFLEQHTSWRGTAKQLLHALEAGFADEKTRHHRDWPTTPRKLSGNLRRLAPSLRAVGWDATFGDRASGGNRPRLILLERTRTTPSQSSQPSPAAANTPSEVGRNRDDGDWPQHADRPGASNGFAAAGDGRDDRDGPMRDCSNGPEHQEEETDEWTG